MMSHVVLGDFTEEFRALCIKGQCNLRLIGDRVAALRRPG